MTKIEIGPVTDGTLSTAGLARAVANEGQRMGLLEPVARVLSSVDALEADPRSAHALMVHEAVNALRDAMNEAAPRGLVFCEDMAGRWGWWDKEDRENGHC